MFGKPDLNQILGFFLVRGWQWVNKFFLWTIFSRFLINSGQTTEKKMHKERNYLVFTQPQRLAGPRKFDPKPNPGQMYELIQPYLLFFSCRKTQYTHKRKAAPCVALSKLIWLKNHMSYNKGDFNQTKLLYSYSFC